MTRDDDFIRELEGYLDEFEGATPLPVSVRNALREELPTTNQVGLRTRFTAWMGVAAALIALAAVAGVNLFPSDVGGPTASASASASLSPTGQPEASPASGELGAYPSGTPWVAAGSHSVTVDGLLLSFDMPNGDWQGHGPFYLAKDTYGPQGAEAIILWTTLPDTLPAPGVGGPIFNGSYVLCRELLGLSPGSSSLADVATVMSTVAGTSRVSGPSDVTVGGRAAKHFSLFATYDVMSNISACSPGLFMSWQDPTEGAMWGSIVIPGDTYRVWIVDVDGKRLLIEAASHWNADASIGDEIQQIIDSIRFE